MKKLLLIIITALFLKAVNAQIPQTFNYQGIARNVSGEPIRYQDISIKISIIDSTLAGKVVYQEVRKVQTNYVGLFNIVIGDQGASNIIGSISTVKWITGNKHIKIEIDPAGNSNFTIAGTTKLQSVPFALYASPTGSASGDLTGNYPAPSIAPKTITTAKLADGIITDVKVAMGISAAKVGLENVDNTSDIDKPISKATLVALDTKVNILDTTVMLNSRFNRDTVSLSNRINLKANDIDVNIALSSKENIQNKSIDIAADGASDSKYPSVKSVKTYVDQIAGTIFTGQVNADWTATVGPAKILNKPSLFSGAYSDLAGKPTLFSGSYADLTNKPIIPAAQVNADWNATNGVSQILNKPILFSGSYADLSGTIPTWNQNTTGNAATASKLSNARKINGVDFDGSADIIIPTSSVSNTFSGTVAIEAGGTGANDAATARSNLGLGEVNNTSDANKPVSSAVSTTLALKVDKVAGKELSSNDYTTLEKNKLAAITGSNTGDQDLSNLATNTALALKANTTDVSTSLALKVDKVAGKELSSNDYTTLEKNKLAAITGSNTGDQDLSNLATNTALALKLDATGNAATATLAAEATKLATPRAINGVAFDGSAPITVTAAAETLTGSTLNATVTGSSLTSVGTLTNLTVTNPIAGSVTGSSGSTVGNAATATLAAEATKLATPRNINGVPFDGSQNITITSSADAASLTGNTLASNVVTSSLTSVGTLTNLTVTNPIAGNVTGNAATVTTNADLTGVVTSSGNVTVIANGVITNAMLANGAVANLSGTNTGDQTATTVSNTSAGTIAATTVQGALNELDTEKAPLASPTFTGTVTIPTLVSGTNTFPTSSGNNNQVLSTNGSGTLTWTTPSASLVSNTAAGTIAATDVQTALNELDTEKAPLASPTFTGSLKVNGAASNSQAKVYAASETSLDFSLSNLISTNASAGEFTLSNMRDGGTYTLAVTGGISGTATFTHSGLTFNSLRNVATTTSKTALYTFIVIGNQVYFSMISVQ